MDKRYLCKWIILFICTLGILIVIKLELGLKEMIRDNVYEKNFSFANVNNWYKNKFGSPLPFDFFSTDLTPVFDEKIRYESISKYKNGVRLNVGDNYLIPSLDNGIIIFIGTKEDYGQTIIVQQENGVDVWYANVGEVNVKLYDYISQGDLIGMASEYLYLLFIKDGEVQNYEDYI